MQYIFYIFGSILYIYHTGKYLKQNTRGSDDLKNLKMKAARAAKDLSQEELAQLVGVTRQTIGMIEAGKYNPTLNLCIAICKALDKTLDELFWEEDEK